MRLSLHLVPGEGIELRDRGAPIANALSVPELTAFFVTAGRQVGEWSSKAAGPALGLSKLFLSALKATRKVA